MIIIRLVRERTGEEPDSVVEENQLSTMKYGIGQPVPRSEDPKLLRGEGNYTDDVNLDGQPTASWSAVTMPMVSSTESTWRKQRGSGRTRNPDRRGF